MPPKKVALITGGASGMGLAVAEALSSRGNWDIHLIDLNTTSGEAAALSLSATFHRADVTSYSSLSSVFKTVFQFSSRLDFVFANAGIAEKNNFYAAHNTGIEPPPELNLSCVTICLNSVISTAYLALHYFRLLPSVDTDKTLVCTASCGGIYPSYYSPTYAAAKHGVVGFMRSIAKHFWIHDHVRVNAICPGVVKTNLLTAREWENFPDQFFTPVGKIVEVVLFLVDGEDPGKGKRVDEDGGERKAIASGAQGGVLWGEAVEISGDKHYYRDAPRLCDDAMQAVMKATDIEELQH